MAVKCKNCGNIVEPKMSGGQITLAIILSLLWIIPGIVYVFACSKQTCPVCGSNVYIKPSEWTNVEEVKEENYK